MPEQGHGAGSLPPNVMDDYLDGKENQGVDNTEANKVEDAKHKISYHGIMQVKTPGGVQNQPFELVGENGKPLDGLDAKYMEYYCEHAFNSNPNILGMAFFRTTMIGAFERPKEEVEKLTVVPPVIKAIPFNREFCCYGDCSNETGGIVYRSEGGMLAICDECWERDFSGQTPIRSKK